MSDIIEGVKDATREQTRLLNVAMDCLPEDKHNWCPSGCAKTPLQIYGECAGIYAWAAHFLSGKQPVEWETFMSRFRGTAALGEARVLMEQAEQQLHDALDNVDEANLQDEVEPGFGLRMTLGQYIFLPSYHTCYHVGQLNYVQTLLGDAEMHF